jgi:hypothetical protein
MRTVSRHGRAGRAPYCRAGGDSGGGAPVLPDDWAAEICAAAAGAVRGATVVLTGSRAVGDATSSSDCDVSVVVPSWKIPFVAAGLKRAATAASELTGVEVSMNPLPRRRYRQPGANLYATKVRLEGVVLCGEQPSDERGGWSGGAACAGALTSYLLSAVHVLVLGLEPLQVTTAELPETAARAVRKATVQVVQAFLLARGAYESDRGRALERLGDEELRRCAERCGDLESFLALRRRLLDALGPVPVALSDRRGVLRNLQFVLLSALRGRNRLQLALSGRSVEGALARSSVLLLASLDPDATGGIDVAQLRRAAAAIPASLRPAGIDWQAVRRVVTTEWECAHPLVGIVA